MFSNSKLKCISVYVNVRLTSNGRDWLCATNSCAAVAPIGLTLHGPIRDPYHYPYLPTIGRPRAVISSCHHFIVSVKTLLFYDWAFSNRKDASFKDAQN